MACLIHEKKHLIPFSTYSIVRKESNNENNREKLKQTINILNKKGSLIIQDKFTRIQKFVIIQRIHQIEEKNKTIKKVASLNEKYFLNNSSHIQR